MHCQSILQAVNHEIEKDENLYQKLQEMRKCLISPLSILLLLKFLFTLITDFSHDFVMDFY